MITIHVSLVCSAAFTTLIIAAITVTAKTDVHPETLIWDFSGLIRT